MRKALVKIKNFLYKNKLLIIILVIIIILSAADRGFLSLKNISSIFRHMTINGIMAVGMTILLISGEFDLSIGSVMSLSGIVTILLQPYGLAVSIIGGLFVGLIIGLINGLLTAIGKIQAFIATLGTMIVGKAIALILTGSVPISSSNESFYKIANSSFLSIPTLIYFFIIAFIIGWFLLNYTRFGKYAYAIGSNEDSVMLAGISVNNYKILYFIFCSIFASIAGIIISSKTATGSAVFGDDAPLIIIAIVVLGGASLSGGKGTILGTLQALIIFGLISKSMITLNISQVYQYIFRGLIILGVVISDAIAYQKSLSNY